MIRLLFAAAVLGLPSLVPAVALAGASPTALCLAPALTALLASAGGMAAIVAGTSVLPWVAVAVLAANLLAVRHLVRRRPEVAPPRTWATSAAVLLTAAVPLLLVTTPRASWDARSIWLLHARWFFAGGSFVAAELGNPVVVFSHPDYPPLIPSVVGTVWRLRGGIDLHLGQQLVALLTVSAAGLLGLAVLRAGRGRLVLPATLLGGAVCAGLYGFAGGEVVNGGADALVAAAAVAAFTYLLVLPREHHTTAVGLVCLAVAGATKNEGLPVVLLVLAFSGLRNRDALRSFLPRAAPVLGIVLVWSIVARSHGARSDILAGLTGELGPDRSLADHWDRAVVATRTLLGWCRRLLLVAAACTVVGLVVARGARRGLGLGTTLAAWATFLAVFVFLVGAYAASPYELGWHLSTSVPRTTILPRLLLVTEMAVWALAASDALLARPLARRVPAPAPPAVRPNGAVAVAD